MILSFGNDATEDLFNGVRSKRARRWAGIGAEARRKLDLLNAATSLAELVGLTGDGLAELEGELAGHHAVRLDHRWRIVFIWQDGAHEVRIERQHA
jgi:proteic killer suppression protein